MNIKNKTLFSLINTKKSKYYLDNPNKKINYKLSLEFLSKINKKTGKNYNLENIFNLIYIRNLPLKAVFEYGNDEDALGKLIEAIMKK